MCWVSQGGEAPSLANIGEADRKNGGMGLCSQSLRTFAPCVNTRTHTVSILSDFRPSNTTVRGNLAWASPHSYLHLTEYNYRTNQYRIIRKQHTDEEASWASDALQQTAELKRRGQHKLDDTKKIAVKTTIDEYTESLLQEPTNENGYGTGIVLNEVWDTAKGQGDSSDELMFESVHKKAPGEFETLREEYFTNRLAHRADNNRLASEKNFKDHLASQQNP